MDSKTTKSRIVMKPNSDESEMRSSLDEFVCIGETRLRMVAALSLAICDDRINAWTEVDGAIHVAHVYEFKGWNRLPDGVNANTLVLLFGKWIKNAPSLFTGGKPDGSSMPGWRIRVDGCRLPSVVVIEPWTLCYAK